jgi:protein-S-isoprenylcysteine O-methyltransferase Ste14
MPSTSAPGAKPRSSDQPAEVDAGQINATIQWPQVSAKTISIIATLIMFACVLVLVSRRSFFGNGVVSITLQILGLLLVVWARLTFGFRSLHFAANPTQGPLITAGPYRYIRNPIYAAVWLVTWTAVAVHWSMMNASVAMVIAIMLVIKILCEERLVRAAYPEYEAYSRRTARLIPFVL